MFIYIEVVKTEYDQREKNTYKKQLDNKDNTIDNGKKDKSLQHPVFPGGHPSKY